ncbi:chromate transporter [Paenibacillus sp. y28]|uniref:chromate transporter n=1 Tax=Paenibacillus sp. y28 TaxID=3129110 RepID=UPI003015A57C
MLWQLFITFFKIGLVSFGGGYAMIPMVQHEVINHGWMNEQQFADAIAVAGMSPGPVATNSAIFVGYHTAGTLGAIISTIGIILPSLLIVVLAAAFFYKVHHHKLVKSAFYGLRPIITGMIVYAAIRFAMSNNMITFEALTGRTVLMLLIFAASLVAMLRFRTHPLQVILISGLIGAAVYG